MQSNTVGYRDLLGQKEYLKLMLANVVSRFGDSLDAIAFSWIMYEVTGNASLIALIMALNYLPSVLLQPFLGVLADRYSKKRNMVLCDWGRGIAVAVTAVLFLLDVLTPLMLIAITLVNSTLEAIRMPASSAIVPYILEKEKYTVGMALNHTLSRVFELIGMGLAGGIIAVLGAQTALLIDGATFVFSALMISTIKCEEKNEGGALKLSMFGEGLRDGFKYLRSNRALFMFILLGACINFSIAPLNSFQSVYVADVLKLGPQALSAMGVALTGGMALGAFAVPPLLKIAKKRTLLLFSGAFETAVIFAFGFIPQLHSKLTVFICFCAATLFLGVVVGIISVIFSSSFTAAIDSEYIARVSGISNAMLLSISPIAAFLCSALATFLTVPQIFLLFGVLHIIIYTAAAFVKEYREL